MFRNKLKRKKDPVTTMLDAFAKDKEEMDQSTDISFEFYKEDKYMEVKIMDLKRSYITYKRISFEAIKKLYEETIK